MLLVASVLAQTPAPPANQSGQEFGAASPVALVVILVLAAATIALIVSMNRRLKRLPASFDDEEQATGPADGSAPDDGGHERITPEQARTAEPKD